MEIAYCGTPFHGWQEQPNAITVQGVLQDALKIVLRTEVECVGCGRTDAGVHAKQFFLHFDFEADLPTSLVYSLNGILPSEVAVKNVLQVSDNFNARFDAQERTYQYLLYFDKNPFYTNNAVQQLFPLDVDLMNQACQHLLGKHDFECFSKVHTDVNNFFCTITQAKWYWHDELLIFEISANRFLRNMVRAIVGTLIKLGEGKITISEFLSIIESKNRNQAGRSMPAIGLYLTNVKYNL